MQLRATRLTAIASAVKKLFSPASLFAANEQGAWYDPSDIERYTSQLGPELVTNGDFSNGTTGWALPSLGSWSVSGGVATIAAAPTGSILRQTIMSVVVGKWYAVSYDIVSVTTNTLRMDVLGSGNNWFFYSPGASGRKTVYVIAQNTVLDVAVYGNAVVSIDNISVRELTAINTATMFQDSAGTTPVTAVEQPVGLILDKSKGLVLGSEIVGSGWVNAPSLPWDNFSTTGSSFTATKSTAGGTDLTYSTNTVPVSLGAWYEISLNVSSTTLSLYSVGLSSTTNLRSTLAGFSGTGLKKAYVYANTASGNFSIFLSTTALGSISVDNISVRELPGNHAFQATTTSRPVLSSRYNLLTKTEQFDDAAWTKTNATVTANATVAPDGTTTADSLIEDTVNTSHFIYQSRTLTSGVAYTFSVYAKAGERGWIRLTWAGATTSSAWFDLVNGTVGTRSGSVAPSTSSIVPVPDADGWFLCSMTVTINSSSANNWNIAIATGDTVTTYTGDGTSGIYVWGADLRVANTGVGLPSYQRVNTATDYDADPAKFPVYLRFDGIDDWLQTNSIDFTATDKMTVFAGVRKLSESTGAILVELSVSRLINQAAFSITAPGGVGERYVFGSRGTADPGAFAITTSAALIAPVTNILTGLGNISGDSVILRANGAQVASSTDDQGTGNYGNYPLYIGRRGGTSLPFNGQIYILIVRGAQTSTTQIAQTERWVAGKTGVTL